MANYKFSTEDEQKIWEDSVRLFIRDGYGNEGAINRADGIAQALFARLPLGDEPEDSLTLEAAN